MLKIGASLKAIIDLLEKPAADLSKPENRRHVAKKNFVFTNKAPKGESKSEAKGKYPRT